MTRNSTSAVPPSAPKEHSHLGTVLLWCIVACAAAGYYFYDRADVEIRRNIVGQLNRLYPRLSVNIRSASLHRKEGILVHAISISDQDAAANHSELAFAEEVRVRCRGTLADMLKRKIDIQHVEMRGVIVRCIRKEDGTWNLAQFFPPPSFSRRPPTVTISNATIEVVDNRKVPASLLTLHNVQIKLAPDKTDASLKSAEVATRRMRFQVAFTSDHVRQVSLHGTVSAQDGSVTLEGDLRGLDINPEFRQSLPEAAAEPLHVLGDFRSGAHGRFRVQRAAGAAAPWEYAIAGEISGGRWEDPRLPFPVSDVSARFELDPQQLAISELRARLGEANIELTYVRRGHRADSPSQVSGSVNQLQVDRRMIDILPEKWQQQWQRWQPLGRLDAAFAATFDGARWHPHLDATLHDVSCLYDKFPYPLRQSTGNLQLHDDELQFKLQALASGQPVRMQGTIQRPGPNWSGAFQVQSDATIPLDTQLIEASKPEIRKILQDFAPRGWISFSATWDRGAAPNPVLKRQMVVQLHDCALRHAQFPYPLDRVRGRMIMNNDHWTFQDLEGYNDSGYVRCQGEWDPATLGGQLSLDFTGTDIPLEDELRDALKPDVRTLWRNLRPRGTLDHVSASLRFDKASRQTRTNVKIDKLPPQQNSEGRTVSLIPAWFPYQMDEVTGTVYLKDGVVHLDGLKARHQGVSMSAVGSAVPAAGAGWKLAFDRITVDRLRADRELLSALPPGIRRALAKLHADGPLAMDGSIDWTFSPQATGPVSANWKLDFDLDDVNMRWEMDEIGGGGGIGLDHVSGRVRVEGATDGAQLKTSGMLDIDSLVWKHVQLTQIRGPFRLEPHQILAGDLTHATPSAEPRTPLTARLFGGAVEADVRYLFENGQCNLQARVRDADLFHVARELSQRPPRVAGRANGVVELQRTAQGNHTLTGKGAVELRDADIYELPVMISLFRRLRAGQPDRTAFTSSDMQFRIQGDRIYFDPIALSGDAISLRGLGEVDLDGNLKVDFFSLVGRHENYLPAVLPMLGEASKRFLTIHVTGTWDNPVATPEVLPELNETLRRLFPEAAERADQRRAELPASRFLPGNRFGLRP